MLNVNSARFHIFVAVIVGGLSAQSGQVLKFNRFWPEIKKLIF